KSACFNRFVFDIDHVCRMAEDLRARKLDSVLLQIRSASHSCADLRTRRTMIANPLVIVPIEALVTSIAALELVVVHVSGESHPSDHEVITAQNFADAFDNVCIETANRGPDRDHGRHADDDSDKSQKSPQFVGKDRLQSNL